VQGDRDGGSGPVTCEPLRQTRTPQHWVLAWNLLYSYPDQAGGNMKRHEFLKGATTAVASESGPLPQRSIGLGPSLPRLVGAAFLKTRQMREALQRTWRRRPTGDGGPHSPWEDHPEGDSIWDDPMLWVLIMMH
jgi:hypothetical protein